MKRAALALLLALAACSADPSADLVKRIVDDLAAQNFARATARYRAEESRVLSPAAAPAWRRALDHQDATVREWAIDALSRIGEAEDVGRVVAALDDPFRRVQEEAASGLVEMDPATARTAFLERLDSDDAMRQTIAAQGLAELGDREGVAPLMERLADSAVDPGVRGVIAQSLGKLGDPRAVPALAAVASDPGNPTALRRTAAETLAGFSGDAATAALRRLLESDDEYIRDLAQRALEGRGG